MKYTVRKADKFIAKTKSSVDNTFRPIYHFTPTVGWINDPNGLIKYGGKYHIFYQYDPYDMKTGAIHWGHSTSDDLLSFTDVGVALAPDAEYEDGCFSGGAETDVDGLTIVYTRHRARTESNEQEQSVCLASSADGLKFVKRAEPVFDNATLPDGIDRIDFRDPYPVKIGDKYYVFVGGKEDGNGIIVVLTGERLDSLSYAFSIGPFAETGCMVECPSYCRVDGRDVIIISGIHETKDFMSVGRPFFIVGDIDFERGKMRVDFIKEIDRGDAFYAPQFVRYADTPTFIAWFENWGKPYPTRDLGHGWVGAFTVPREIFICGENVIQQPVAALKKKRVKTVCTQRIPSSCDITAHVGKDFLCKITSRDGAIAFGNEGGRIYLDTRCSNNGNERILNTEREYGECDIRVLIDVSCIEIFVDGGKEVISSRIYLYGDYALETSGSVNNLTVYEICT